MSKNDTSRSKEVSTKVDLDYESMHSTSSSTHSVDTLKQSPFFMLPKSLPDIDDDSMNHVFEYLEHYEQDIFWSYLSDLFFIAGGLIYVYIALWDFIWPPEGLRNYYTFDVLALAVYRLYNMTAME